MPHILRAALLSLIEQAGTSVAILIEGLEREDLLRTRLTRLEVLRQLKVLADSLAQLGGYAREALPELDWDGWNSIRTRFDAQPGEALDEALWFACESLVPATLLWLRVYQQSQPELFRMSL
jgi:uncharacterized protein with HEPN domain